MNSKEYVRELDRIKYNCKVCKGKHTHTELKECYIERCTNCKLVKFNYEEPKPVEIVKPEPKKPEPKPVHKLTAYDNKFG